MNASEALAFAKNLIRKCQARKRKFALCIAKGSPICVDLDSVTFSRVEALNMKALVGIYGARCKPEDIRDDLLDALKS